MEQFAANLRRRAEMLGLSHAEVARRAGISVQRYNNYVAGSREPNLPLLVRIAAALETTPNDLLNFREPGNAERSPDIAQAQSLLAQMPPEVLDLVMAQLIAIVRRLKQSDTGTE